MAGSDLDQGSCSKYTQVDGDHAQEWVNGTSKKKWWDHWHYQEHQHSQLMETDGKSSLVLQMSQQTKNLLQAFPDHAVHHRETNLKIHETCHSVKFIKLVNSTILMACYVKIENAIPKI